MESGEICAPSGAGSPHLAPDGGVPGHDPKDRGARRRDHRYRRRPSRHICVVMDIGHILCSLVMMFGFVIFGSYVFV